LNDGSSGPLVADEAEHAVLLMAGSWARTVRSKEAVPVVLLIFVGIAVVGLGIGFFMDWRIKRQRGYLPEMAQRNGGGPLDNLAAGSFEAALVGKKQRAAQRGPNHLD